MTDVTDAFLLLGMDERNIMRGSFSCCRTGPNRRSPFVTTDTEPFNCEGQTIRRAAARWGIGATTLRDHLRACAETVPSQTGTGPA